MNSYKFYMNLWRNKPVILVVSNDTVFWMSLKWRCSKIKTTFDLIIVTVFSPLVIWNNKSCSDFFIYSFFYSEDWWGRRISSRLGRHTISYGTNRQMNNNIIKLLFKKTPIHFFIIFLNNTMTWVHY